MNFRGKGEPRSRATRRGKRGKQQRSGLGFPLKQAKNEKADAACAAPALFLFVFHLTQARQNRILQASPLKCAVRIFRTSATCRASEGGKSEFLRVRRARDLDTLPQKERKPRLKKTILRRNRVPPQRAMVRYIRGVVFEWRGCRSKSEKSRGGKSSQLFRLFPRDFSLNSIRFAAPPPDPSSTRYKKGYCRRAR